MLIRPGKHDSFKASGKTVMGRKLVVLRNVRCSSLEHC